MTDELLIKFLLKETGAEEDRRVHEWLAADEANRKYYAGFEKIWAAGKTLESTSTADVDAAWQRFKGMTQASAEVKPRVHFLRQINWLRLAAALIIIGAAWTVYITQFRNQTTTLASNLHVLTETLPDGSEVTLNKNSVLSYSGFNKNTRKVVLQKGEVFFDVAPDKTKPFVISAGKVTIRVVGTSFNVKHNKQTTEVIVETGIVRVGVGATQEELRRGDKLLIGADNRITRSISADQLYNYYRSGKFVANQTPLPRIAEVLSEAYQREIRIGNPRLNSLTLTTTFKTDAPLDEILRVISETLDIRVVHDGNKIILE